MPLSLLSYEDLTASFPGVPEINISPSMVKEIDALLGVF